jgi:signal transduction histidine kinase
MRVNRRSSFIAYIVALALLGLAVFMRPARTLSQQSRTDSLEREVNTLRANNAPNDTSLVNALNALAAACRLQTPAKAITLAHEALRHAEQAKFTKGRANAHFELGMAYRIQSKYDAALEHHLAALTLREQLGDSVAVASSLDNVGAVHYRQGNYEQALNYHRKAELIHRATRNNAGLLNNYIFVGTVYYNQKRYDDALTSFTKALELRQYAPDEQRIAALLNNLGRVNSDIGRFDRAEQLYKEALAINKRLGSVEGLTIANSNLALALIRQGGAARARRGLELGVLSLRYADSITSGLRQKEAMETIAEAYDSLGDARAALRYVRRAAAINDSLKSEQSSKKLAELQTQYDIDKKNREIALLERDKILREEQLGRQTWQRNALIAALVAAAIVGFAAWQRYRLVQRARTRLQEKNEEILRQQKILEDQASEIELSNTQLQERNVELHEANESILQQQQLLEEQARDIEIVNSELHERNAQLEDLNREKNEFLGIAAHDLKNPLAAIVFGASMIRQYAHNLTPDELTKQVERIEHTAQRMREIITTLLDVNAIESGAVQINFEAVDAAALTASVVEEYQQAAEKKSIVIQNLTTATTPLYIWADRRVTYEVLDNLLSNAVKYSPPHTSIVVVAEPAAFDTVRVSIQDEGPGLSDDDKSKLFGKFARLSAKPTGGEHSTGLGLSIVKKLVEAMHGRVWCESVVGAGATFTVELPDVFSARHSTPLG